MMSRRHIRVFISSPGDVLEERRKARQTIDHLRVDPLLRDEVDLEEIAWDDPDAPVAMLGSLTPQQAINQGLPKPSDCEIVVVILWARMGTPLPPEYTKADGSRYLSGTEWEYWDAVTAARKSPHKLPLLLVYRCQRAPELVPDEDGKRLEQWNHVQKLFASFTNPDGSLNQGYNPYQSPDDFAELLETHLKDLIKRTLDATPSRTLHNGKRRWIFGGALVAVVIAILLGVHWLTTREIVMDGSFNIALAQFALPENPPMRAVEAFDRIHQTLLNLLINEYTNTGVQVQPQRFGVVLTDAEAEKLAGDMKADIVIYGTVEYSSNSYKYTPHFYVANRFRDDVNEIVGDHEWLQETLSDDQLDKLIQKDSDERKRLDLKAGILTQFTQALVYLTTNDLRPAEDAIVQAIGLVEQYNQRYTIDIPANVIYLFGSTIFRRAHDYDQAEIYAEVAAADPTYGRGQIALGHIYYERGAEAYYAGDRPDAFNNLNTARGYYETALTLKAQPLTAFVAEKAHLSLGNIYQVLYQIVGEGQKPKFLINAITNYQAVLTSFADYKTHWIIAQVAPIAAESAHQMGSMYTLAGQFSNAENAYQGAVGLATDDNFKEMLQATLSSVQTMAADTALVTPTATP